jgi:hypothetical protein
LSEHKTNEEMDISSANLNANSATLHVIPEQVIQIEAIEQKIM